ncbi:cytochrome P450 2J6-like [Pecten maximus]|uniref:cytochrome P450 2J6-like n=1 Tax=Pecten maximus TaxID=6579 RepID=UPI00145871F1|nr:cytochrome P450 2J6-like [Pecten maximus]
MTSGCRAYIDRRTLGHRGGRCSIFFVQRLSSNMSVLDSLDFISAFIAFIVLIFSVKWLMKRRNLPPGPYGWPLFGSIMLMKTGTPTDVFRKLRQKYGDVFSIKLGTLTVVVINGYENLKEAFVKRADDFSDRPETYVIVELSKEKGLMASSGELWKQNRTFVLKALREFGFGKKSLETKIHEEVDVFIKYVMETGGQPFDINRIIHVSVSNVICSIVFGERFDHNDARFVKLVSLLDEAATINKPTGLISCFPALRHLPGDMFKIKRFKKVFSEFLEHFSEQVQMHRDSFHENETRDFIDAFIQEQKSRGRDTQVFTDDNLLITLLHLFAAGTETVATGVRYSVLYLLHNPDIQEKMFTEINTVVGQSRPVTGADRSNMPYSEAMLTEVLRCANIVPLSVQHGAKKDIAYKGFVIPKDAMIIPNLDSVLGDPTVFPEPEKFDPSRFLDAEGAVINDKKMIAFSIGRRVCLGESLAKLELFLFVTSLVQKFDLRLEHSGVLPSLEGRFGLTRSPMPYRFRAVPRS